ncbi:MAG: S8 family peptidase [Anaerolineales bacterium]
MDGYTADMLELPQGAVLSPLESELQTLNAVIVNVPAGQEESYRNLLLQKPGVLYAETNFRVQALTIPNDPLWLPSAYTPDGQYGPQRIQAPDAWNITQGANDVIIAVIDSGVDSSHPEFKGRLLPGYDYVEDDWTPQDRCGHGTHVAGIIAANGNNAYGIAGMDWNARILPVRVLDASCGGTISDLAEGLIFATDMGARVINLSVGTPFFSRLLEHASYYAYQHGAALFAAIGNLCSFPGQVVYPAYFSWVMAVGATNQLDERNSISCTGDHLDVMAPGTDILSTAPMTGELLSLYGMTHKFSLLSGTSMATAFVSGAAGLLASQTGFDTPTKIYTALTSTARDLEAAGFDDNTGYGLIQVADALNSTPGGPPPPPPAAMVEYDFLDSTRCSNVTYQWRAIPHNWTGYPAGSFIPLFGDNVSTNITLPFTFNFGGNSYNSVTVSSNGYLAFDGIGEKLGNTQATNFLIPLRNGGVTYGSDAFLAPFWDDLKVDPSSMNPSAIYAATLGSVPNREFVVEWYRVPQSGTAFSSLTFQAILRENSNRIIYQYKEMKGNVSSSTIGLEYNEGYSGIQVAYNQYGAVKNGQAVYFYPYPAGNPRTVPACQTTTTANSAGKTILFPPFCLEIPSGLLPATPDTTIRMSVFSYFPPSTSQTEVPIGRYSEITLDPTPRPPLSPPPRVCYYYTAGDLVKAGGDPQNLFLAVFDSQTRLWERLPTSLDTVNNRIIANVPHFSIFGVFTIAQPESLPVTGGKLR